MNPEVYVNFLQFINANSRNGPVYLNDKYNAGEYYEQYVTELVNEGLISKEDVIKYKHQYEVIEWVGEGYYDFVYQGEKEIPVLMSIESIVSINNNFGVPDDLFINTGKYIKQEYKNTFFRYIYPIFKVEYINGKRQLFLLDVQYSSVKINEVDVKCDYLRRTRNINYGSISWDYYYNTLYTFDLFDIYVDIKDKWQYFIQKDKLNKGV